MAWFDGSDQQSGRKDKDEETQRPAELGRRWTRSGERETDEPPPFLCYAGLQVVRFYYIWTLLAESFKQL